MLWGTRGGAGAGWWGRQKRKERGQWQFGERHRARRSSLGETGTWHEMLLTRQPRGVQPHQRRATALTMTSPRRLTAQQDGSRTRTLTLRSRRTARLPGSVGKGERKRGRGREGRREEREREREKGTERAGERRGGEGRGTRGMRALTKARRASMPLPLLALTAKTRSTMHPLPSTTACRLRRRPHRPCH